MKKNLLRNVITVAASAFLLLLTPLRGQTILYSQNFDADSSALPADWSASGGWHVETSNVSTGYIGASGLVNVAIRNDSATGIYSLISASVSTVGYNTISVIWGARLTTNFPATGSAIQGLYWSIDGGTTWNNVAYTENTNNSNWSLDNAGLPVGLPAAAANQPSLRLKIVASIVTGSQGTYRIDDFTVAGIANTGIAGYSLSLTDVAVSPNPSAGPFVLSINATSRGTANVYVYDLLGAQTGGAGPVSLVAGSNAVTLDERFFPAAGLYFIRVEMNGECRTVKAERR